MPTLERIPVNITGLKDLFRDGLTLPPRKIIDAPSGEDANGLVILIKGKPGTGKSTLALRLTEQIAENLKSGGNSYYYSLEQDVENICNRLIDMSINKIAKEYIEKHYQKLKLDSLVYSNEKTKIKGIDLCIVIKKVIYEKYSSALINKLLDVKINESFDVQTAEKSENKEDYTLNEDAIKQIKREIKNKLKKAKLVDTDGILSSNLIKSITKNIKEIISSVTKRRNLYTQIAFFDNTKTLSKPDKPYNKYNQPLSTLADFIEDIQERIGTAKQIIIDGLNIISSDDLKYLNLHQLINVLRNKSKISIIIYEPNDHEDGYLEYMADMVIELKQVSIETPITYWINELNITKSRYQNAVLGWHQYKIRDYGIEVYPSIHYQVHLPNYLTEQLNESTISLSEPIKTFIKKKLDDETDIHIKKNSSIIERMVDITPGSFTVILGARATYKTTFTFDFLAKGASNDEHGILISLIDYKESILETYKKCPRKIDDIVITEDDKCLKCYDKIYCFLQRPGCITPAEFFHFLNDRLIKYKDEATKIKRAVFWDLTQLEFRFPLLASDPMFLPGLMDFFKKQDIAVVVMSSGNAQLAKAAAAMADNVLFCWRDKLKDEYKVSNESPKTFKSNDNKYANECIAMYIDRSGGHLGGEGKKLYAFSITKDDNKGDLLNIPKCDGTHPNFEDLNYDTFNDFFIVKNSSMLVDADKKISYIELMQGIGEVDI